MPGNTGHLAHLDPWFAQWLEPAYYQIYRGEVEAALATVAQAREQLERETGLSPDERQLLEYELAWTPFNLLSFMGPFEAVPQAFAQAEAALAVPPGPLSAPTQAFYRIALASRGYPFGLTQPDVHALRRLLDTIPPERFVPGSWAHIASLAFHLGERELLEEAFGELTVSSTGMRDSYVWLRINLMYLLSEDRAQAEDVRQLLANLHHISELYGFRRDFAAVLAARGLWEGFAAQVDALERELAAKLQPPRIERRTRRAVGRD